MKEIISRDLKVLALLALLSLAVGIGIDQMRAQPLGISYRTSAQRLVDKPKSEDSPLAPISEKMSPISRVIDIGQLQELLNKNQALVFDVRPNILFKLGHIPGAYSLQEKEFDADLMSAKSLIEVSLAKGHKIVVYCSGSHCSDASKVAKKLSDLGHGNLMIFENGWESWQEAKLPEEQEAL